MNVNADHIADHILTQMDKAGLRSGSGALGDSRRPDLDAEGRQPLISNTDQGTQFTSEAYLEAVESVGVDVSMDGRGRWIDNRFIERLWRSVKQEDNRRINAKFSGLSGTGS